MLLTTSISVHILIRLFSMFKSPARNMQMPKRSPVSFIKTVASPRHPNNTKNIAFSSHDFSTDHFNKQGNTLMLTLQISLQKVNVPHRCIFTYNNESTIGELVDYMRKELRDSYLFFKSRDINVDYLLTLAQRKVRELRVKRLQLTACRLKIDGKGALLKNLQIIKCVGTGGFSRVYLVRGYGQLMALKVINKQFIVENEKLNIIENQRTILERCSGHPFITKLYMSFQTKNYLFFCLQYCNGGELFNLLRKVRRMSEEQAKFYFLQTLSAIEHLHSQKILYRDLKPENIIIDSQGHVRLADYGLSKIMKDDLTHSFCGSAQYMAPEMLLKKGHSFQIDYYCLGALLYQLLLGLPPYYSRNQNQLFNNILTKDLQFPPNVELSKQLKKFLHRMLEKDTDLRFKRISQILAHPWLADINMDDVFNKKLNPPFKTDMFCNNFDQSEFSKDEEKQRFKLQVQKDNCNLPIEEQVFQDFTYVSKQFKDLQTQIKKEGQKRLDFSKKPPQTVLDSSQKQIFRNTNMKSIDNNRFFLDTRYGQNSPRIIQANNTLTAKSSDKFKMFISQTPPSYISQASHQPSQIGLKSSQIVNVSTQPSEISNSSGSKLMGVRSVPMINKIHAFSPSHERNERMGSPININNYINIYTNKSPAKGPQISFTSPTINFIGSPKKTLSYGHASFERSINGSGFKNGSNVYGSINGSLQRSKFSSLDKPLISTNNSGFLKNNVYYHTANTANTPAGRGYLSNFKQRLNPNQKIKKSYKINEKFSFNNYNTPSIYKH